MGFFKKYPVFTSLVAVFCLLFVAGLVFIYLSYTGLTKAEKRFDQTERSYRSALGLSPAPTSENAEVSEKNVQELATALQAQIEATKGRVPTFISKKPPQTETDMLFQLEAFKEQFTKDAAEVVPLGAPEGTTGIKLPDDFAFSFSRFLDSGTPPPAKFIPAIYEQKEILAYLLRKLYDSEPFSIESIQREVQIQDVETEKSDTASGSNARRSNAGNANGPKDEFEVGSISARVPGAVETVAFRFVFTGYTPSLRTFLKQLEEFELPLVVRSVEVQPFQQKSTARSSSSNRADNPFSLFDMGGDADAAPNEAAREASREPVVEENLSQFTVVVEYIKVLVKAPSDVATLEDTTSSKNPM